MTLSARESQAAFQKWVQKNLFLEKNKLKQYKEHTERLSFIYSSYTMYIITVTISV